MNAALACHVCALKLAMIRLSTGAVVTAVWRSVVQDARHLWSVSRILRLPYRHVRDSWWEAPKVSSELVRRLRETVGPHGDRGAKSLQKIVETYSTAKWGGSSGLFHADVATHSALGEASRLTTNGAGGDQQLVRVVVLGESESLVRRYIVWLRSHPGELPKCPIVAFLPDELPDGDDSYDPFHKYFAGQGYHTGLVSVQPLRAQDASSPLQKRVSYKWDANGPLGMFCLAGDLSLDYTGRAFVEQLAGDLEGGERWQFFNDTLKTAVACLSSANTCEPRSERGRALDSLDAIRCVADPSRRNEVAPLRRFLAPYREESVSSDALRPVLIGLAPLLNPIDQRVLMEEAHIDRVRRVLRNVHLVPSETDPSEILCRMLDFRAYCDDEVGPRRYKSPVTIRTYGGGKQHTLRYPEAPSCDETKRRSELLGMTEWEMESDSIYAMLSAPREGSREFRLDAVVQGYARLHPEDFLDELLWPPSEQPTVARC
ncbi:MAG: hypothetical protein FJ290_02040 [Planctomycetes bacterium]|nr:hypothetical protein [Planctomycetota bacterium]